MVRLVTLTFRLHRFEILAVAIGALLLTAAALFISWQLRSLGVPLTCFGQPDVHGATGSITSACLSTYAPFQSINGKEAEPLFAVLVGFPVLAGMLVGAPAVSRELEHGTASLPWTLSGRRKRWLARRVLILAAILVAALIPLGLAADGLEAIRNPTVDASRSFGSEGLRGGVLVARGVAGFGAGLLLGLVVGRQLPTVILGLVASGLLLVGGLAAMDGWSRSAATYVSLDHARLGDRSILAALRGHDGRIVSMSDVVDLQPPRPDLPPGTIDDQWIAANFDEVLLVVPGSRYGEEVAIHSALLGGVAVAAILASLLLIERRRVA
jgi:hypothetical protein